MGTSGKRFETVPLRNAQVGFFSAHFPGGELIDCNAAYAQLLGYDTREQCLADCAVLEKQIDPATRDVLLAKLETNDMLDAFEVRARFRNAQDRWIKICSTVDRAHGLHEGVVLDISARKLAEETLRESEQKYRTLVENLPQKIFFKNVKSVYISVNQKYAVDLGVTPEAMVGKTDHDFYPNDLAEKYRQDDQRVMRAGETEELDETYTTDAGAFTVHTIKTPVRDVDGTLVGILGIFWDVTTQKRAEAAERELQLQLRRHHDELEAQVAIRTEELEQFTYIASHDLQEPLRQIQAFGDRLAQKSGSALDSSGQDYLRRMQEAAARGQRMVNDLLSYSRITTQHQPFEPVDLAKIVDAVVEGFETRLEQTGGSVRKEALPTIEGDSTQLFQLLQNLIGNALKFARPDTPEVTIDADMGDPTSIALCVQDNGIGFDPQYLERIFQPFQRLHGRTAYDGTGVGLAICKKIVGRHGGTITAQGTPGAGACFIITLPRTQSENDA